MKWIIALIMFLLVSTAYADPYEIPYARCELTNMTNKITTYPGMEYNETTGEWTFGPEFKEAIRELVIGLIESTESQSGVPMNVYHFYWPKRGNQTSYSEGELR